MMSEAKSPTDILHDIQTSLQGVTTTLHHIERRFQKVENDQVEIWRRVNESGKTDWKLLITIASAIGAATIWLFQSYLTPITGRIDALGKLETNQITVVEQLARYDERQKFILEKINTLETCQK